MANKQAILENVSMYSADELVEYIRQGIVTFKELCDDTDGEFSAAVRKDVEQKMSSRENEEWNDAKLSNSVDKLNDFISKYPSSSHVSEAKGLIEQLKRTSIDDEWKDVNKEDIDELKQFCELHPSNTHVSEAKRLINKLRKEAYLGYDIEALIKRIKNIQVDNNVINKDVEMYKTIVGALDRGKISSTDLLEMIRRDHNVLRASVIKELLDDGRYLEYDGLKDIGIDSGFMSYLVNDEKPQSFSIPKELNRINKLSTEVYFWGIPSSGKSCALGAILSVARNGKVAKSMRQDNDSQGYGYMTRLSSLFKSDNTVCTLPEGTSIYSTYEMGFDLEDQNGAEHPLTCIDLAGELVRCMYKNDAGEEMSSDETVALETLTRILIDNRSRNRKIHFFVLEYGAEDRKYEGLTQSFYLDAALRYIERTKIFKDDTDAIFLIISKVDKAPVEKGQLINHLREYISNNYGGFYNGLVKICHDCEINSGLVEIIPFSLGNVCFQDYCLFDEKPAANVLRKLLECTKGFKNGKLQKGLNLFKR